MQLSDSSAAGLHIGRQTRAAGPIAIEPAREHRVMIHAGGPVRGSCGHHRFTYRHGDVDLVPAGQSDTCHYDDAVTHVVLRLEPALVRRAAADLGLDPDRASIEPRHQFRDPQIEHIAWALDAARNAGQPTGALYRESLGLALAVHLLGRFPAVTSARRGLSKLQLGHVTEYIEAHLDRDLSLERLAEIANVSASHLKAAFRRSTGTPVHAYVVRRRVERAKQLLLRGELPASEIALEAGFAHQSHMARCMRKVLGVTPRRLSGA